jgi:hypothetical protein
MSIQVAVGTADAVPVDGPTQIAPHGRITFELAPTSPTWTKAGSLLSIIITVNASDSVPARQQIEQRISDSSMCPQGRLTRDVYLATRKKMRDMLSSGTLSKLDFDDRDADLVSCLQ